LALQCGVKIIPDPQVKITLTISTDEEQNSPWVPLLLKKRLNFLIIYLKLKKFVFDGGIIPMQDEMKLKSHAKERRLSQ